MRKRKNMLGLFYNVSRKLYLLKIPLLPKLIWIFNRMVFSSDLPYTANISPSVTFSHNGLGTVVNAKSTIKDNCIILQNVTIGGNMGKNKIIDGKKITSPIIEKNVLIGASSIILGPVTIGQDSVIGAGSVVLTDIPAGSVAVGSPAKVIKSL